MKITNQIFEDESDSDDDAPILPCIVSANPGLKSGILVNALPDSGCDISTVTKSTAMKIGASITSTPAKLYDATGAKLKVMGQAIIFTKVDKVTVKKLRVLVEEKASHDFTICYQDLITLRVLASNFPNQVTQKKAPFLHHPFGNIRTTPLLSCRVRAGFTVDVIVKAVPDTGCNNVSVISKDLASMCKILIFPTTLRLMASGNKVDVLSLIHI